MIEYLEKLVEDKQYEKALAYAEQVLLSPETSAWDLMVVYSKLCEARCETGEFFGAQVAGELAVKMARELEAWDYFGAASLWLGVAHERLRQSEEALVAWYDYLAHVPRYREAIQYHVMVLYNIGLVQAQTGQQGESLRTLKKAAEVATSMTDHRKAHGIRHALINLYLRYGQFEQIPPLLAKCAHYLRHNSNAEDYTQSLLWHLVIRVRFAVATHRLVRATRLARRGLQLAAGRPDVVYEFYLRLAQVHEQLGNARFALEQALQARSVAMQARRFDLEYAAAHYVYGMLTSNAELLDSLPNTEFKEWDPSAVD